MGRHGRSSVPNDDPLSIKLDIFLWNVQLTVMSPPVISSQDTNITLNNHHKLPLQSTTASFPVLHSSKLYLKQGDDFAVLTWQLNPLDHLLIFNFFSLNFKHPTSGWIRFLAQNQPYSQTSQAFAYGVQFIVF